MGIKVAMSLSPSTDIGHHEPLKLRVKLNLNKDWVEFMSCIFLLDIVLRV
jgi:hypothetical protein